MGCTKPSAIKSFLANPQPSIKNIAVLFRLKQLLFDFMVSYVSQLKNRALHYIFLLYYSFMQIEKIKELMGSRVQSNNLKKNRQPTFKVAQTYVTLYIVICS